MSLGYRSLRRISRLLPHVYSGNNLQQSREAIGVSFGCLTCLPYPCYDIGSTRTSWGRFHSQRYSTISQVLDESSLAKVGCYLSLFESTINEFRGPHHCWINKDEGNKDLFKKDGIFLILFGKFLENPQRTGLLEKVKLLQQRFPQLHVMGFDTGSSICSAVDQTSLVDLIMKEFITFPICLSNKHFFEDENEQCFILFKDFKNPVIYHETVDLGILTKAIEELVMQQNGNSDNGNSNLHNLKSTWWRQPEINKEPYFCSSLQNLLLYFPSCISADESGDRLFLSDSNHHRIIIFDGNGKIVDCIGSSPGFEDGEFETAKLACPAASFYEDTEDCLYIVDSENHAIRRADMDRRVLETLYPTCSISKKNNSLWKMLLNKLGFGRSSDTKAKEVHVQSMVFPWHILKTADNSLLIISHSFESLWIMDLASGEIKEVVKGFPKILETFEHLVMEKISLLNQIPIDWLQRQIDTECSPKNLPYVSLMSSVTTFQNQIVMCDTAAHMVLNLNSESGASSNFKFSNFGILGFPYWLSCPLERVYSFSGHCGAPIDHLQCFNLLPGRVDIKLNVEIPVDTELVEPLQEECIWCQARGAATEASGAKSVAVSSEKVGVAQQWYDELDNLAFSTPESEMVVEDDNRTSDVNWQEEGRVHINCAVNTSPGSSEVIIHAVLYLKLRKHPDLREHSQEELAVRIAKILNPGRNGGMGRETFIQLLLKSNRDLRDFVFARPLHVRIKLDSPDHQKADNTKGIILTDSSIEVNVSLQT